MKLEPISDLVFDSTVYPRHDISRTHVNELVDAFQADQNVPPIVACKETKKLIDGIHRWHALIDMFKEKAQWYIKWEVFNSDDQRFMRSIELNAHHGLRLTKYDQAHCFVIAQKLGIDSATLAAGMGVTRDRFETSMRDRFTGSVNELAKKPQEPLKRTIKHMAGKKLTKEQIEVNKKLSGWPTKYHASQIIMVIESKMLEEDEETMDRLKVLHEKLEEVLVAV